MIFDVQIIIELMFAPGIGAHHSAKCDGSSLECIWEAGVGVLHSPPSDSVLDNTRTELVRLLVTGFEKKTSGFKAINKEARIFL